MGRTVRSPSPADHQTGAYNTRSILTLAVVIVASAMMSWVIMSRFGVLAIVLAIGGIIGLSVLTYISNKDLSFALMLWMISMGGFRTIGMVRMPGLPDFSFDRLLLIWIIMMFGVRIVIERMKMPGPYKADYFILAHTIYIVVQLHLMESIHVHTWVISSLSPFFAYLYGRYIIRSSREIRNIIIFFGAMGLYFGITAIAEKFGLSALIWPKQILNPEVGALWQAGRSRGPVMHPPLNGQLLGMMLLIFVLFISKAKTMYWRVVSLGGFVIVGLGVFFAYTRGPWLATLAALGVMGLLRPNFRRILMGFALLGLVIGMLGLGQIMNSEFLQERVKNDQTVENRLMFLSAALKMIRDYPIFGLGFFRYNDYRDVYHQGVDIPFYGYVSKHMGEGMVIHDIYIGRLAEEGIVSVLMLFGFTLQIFRAGLFKWRRKLKDNWFNKDTLTLFAGIMVCFHIGGMVIDYRYFDLINVFYFLLAGIIYGYRNVEYGFGQAQKRDLPSRQYV